MHGHHRRPGTRSTTMKVHFGAVLTASTLALSLAVSPPAIAKPKQQNQPQQTTTASGGTSGGVTGRNVSASTSGTGYLMTGPGAQGAGVSGTADATAVDGTVNTRIDGTTTEERARLKATATARTDDERARSRTQTLVSPNDTIRSRTTSMYKAQGEKPVKETTTTIVCADGRVVDKMAGCRSR